MKKATSFLLALVMLISMLPAAAVPVAAAESTGTLNAYYTHGTVKVDGKLDEGRWLLTEKVGSTPAALLCDQENLYVALQTGADKAEVTLNGVTAVADLNAGSVTANGAPAGTVTVLDGVAEAQISLAAFNTLYDPGQIFDVVITVGQDSFKGTLNFAHQAMLLADDFANTKDKVYAKELGKVNDESYVVEENGSLHFKTNTMTDAGKDGRVSWTPSRSASGMDFSRGHEIVLNVDFNDLIVPAADMQAYWGSTGFTVWIGTDMLMSHGFYADAAGNIYVSQYETSHSFAMRFDTGLDLPAKDVNIRLVTDDDFATEVFVNGKSVGKFPVTSRTGSRDGMYLWVNTGRRDLTSSRKNDVLVHDMYMVQDAPAAQMSAAEVAAGSLALDGAPNESFWSLNNQLGNTRYGLLCDTENLYVALDTTESTVKVAFGEVKGTAKLGSNPSFALGFTQGSSIKGNGKGQYEIAIPLNLIHQTAPAGQKMPFGITSGNKTREFDVTLGGGVVLKQTVYAPVSGDGKNDAVAYLDVAGVKLDGNLKDLQWYTPYKAAGSNKAAGAEFGFMWDANNLYLGGQIFTAARADKVELTMGGKTLIADLQAGTATAGKLFLSGQYLEWALPKSELGLSGMGSKTNYEIKVTNAGGTSKLYGALELIGTSVVLGDTASDLNTKDYVFRMLAEKTTWTQGDGYQVLRTDPSLGGTSESYQHYALPHLAGGAYNFTVDLQVHTLPTITGSYAWRALCWEIRQERLQTRFALRDDGSGNILCDMLYFSVVETVPIGKKFGDRFTFTVSVDENDVPTLYIDGKWVHTFQKLDRTSFTIVDDIPMPQLRCDIQNNYTGPNAEGKFLGTNVDIFSTLWTQSYYESNEDIVNTALDKLTEASVLGGNPADVVKLNLPKQVDFAANGVSVPVTWKAIDNATGQVATNVNTDTGAITRSPKPLSCNLIATATYGGVTLSKTIIFTTKGSNANGKVALIVDDATPATGSASNFTVDSYEWFDTTHNSLVYDQGAVKAFNTIKLYDMDEYSRVAQRHLGVFVSDDGKNFTKVTGWLLYQDGKEYTLYNLNETARYVKVHTYHDAMDMSGLGEPTFYNAIQSMMTVSNEQNLPLAGGSFAHKAEYTVKNDTDKEQKDTPVFIAIADLGAKAGQYKADASDFRFTMGGKTLAQWYNGKDGFYVRVPAIAAKGSAAVTAHWGNSSAKDFSDAEGVFEVNYGNVALINLSYETYQVMGSNDAMASHGRPFTFPNGDVIVVGRRYQDDCDLAVYRSTDGGHTFTTKPILAHDDIAAIKSGIMRASGFGGFLWDDSIGDKGRLYLIGYSGSVYDSNDYRLFLTYSDDYGYTWSPVRYISDPALEKVKEDDYVLQNGFGKGITRAILYCDGLTMQNADGAGPNVDYVIVHNIVDTVNDRNGVAAMYSKDGGQSWTCSDNYMHMDIPGTDLADYVGTLTMLPENGMSETGFAQLDDGSLYLVMRAQQLGNLYLWEGRSNDLGKTWSCDFSKIPSSNTSPVLMKYGNDRLVMHSTRTSVGATTYYRSPMFVGLSSDNYATFDNYLDVTFGTSFDNLKDSGNRMTQPGMAISPDGKDIFVSWYDHTYKDKNYMEKSTLGFLVEDFDQMIYGTKGGYEDFEDSSLKYMGWLVDYAGKIELTREASASGLQAMKVVDGNSNETTHAARQVPAMKKGTVGAKIMAPASNKDAFTFELRAAFGFDYLVLALATVAIAPDGTISLCYEKEKVAVAKVEPGTWNDIAVSFDIEADMGKLYVNGEVVSDIKLKTSQTIYPRDKYGKNPAVTHEDVIREICSIQFGQLAATKETGDCLYVDDFYAVELTQPLNRAADNISFADVKHGDWFYDAVSFAVENKIMSGYNATTFGPNDTLTRAMVVQVLYNKEGQPALNGLTHSFSDVPANQWFNNAVTWGSNRGVVSGFGGGVFKPEGAVAIEQVAVILRNYSGSPNGNGDLSKVGNHSDWAADALKWAVEKGILENVPFTNATEQATRAQTAQMLTNYLRAN